MVNILHKNTSEQDVIFSYICAIYRAFRFSNGEQFLSSFCAYKLQWVGIVIESWYLDLEWKSCVTHLKTHLETFNVTKSNYFWTISPTVVWFTEINASNYFVIDAPAAHQNTKIMFRDVPKTISFQMRYIVKQCYNMFTSAYILATNECKYNRFIHYATKSVRLLDAIIKIYIWNSVLMWQAWCNNGINMDYAFLKPSPVWLYVWSQDYCSC